MRQGGELVAQGEILQYQRLSGAGQGAKPPEGDLEEEKHRRIMRASLYNGKVCQKSLGKIYESGDFVDSFRPLMVEHPAPLCEDGAAKSSFGREM